MEGLIAAVSFWEGPPETFLFPTKSPLKSSCRQSQQCSNRRITFTHNKLNDNATDSIVFSVTRLQSRGKYFVPLKPPQRSIHYSSDAFPPQNWRLFSIDFSSRSSSREYHSIKFFFVPIFSIMKSFGVQLNETQRETAKDQAFTFRQKHLSLPSNSVFVDPTEESDMKMRCK